MSYIMIQSPVNPRLLCSLMLKNVVFDLRNKLFLLNLTEARTIYIYVGQCNLLMKMATKL